MTMNDKINGFEEQFFSFFYELPYNTIHGLMEQLHITIENLAKIHNQLSENSLTKERFVIFTKMYALIEKNKKIIEENYE